MNDLKFALRQLWKNPGFAAVAMLTLALGIGACTAMFSVVHAVMLRPLPFREPGRLVWIENVFTGGLSARTTRVDNFLEWRKQADSFEMLGAYFAFFDYTRYTLLDHGERVPRRGTTHSVAVRAIPDSASMTSHSRTMSKPKPGSHSSPISS